MCSTNCENDGIKELKALNLAYYLGSASSKCVTNTVYSYKTFFFFFACTKEVCMYKGSYKYYNQPRKQAKEQGTALLVNGQCNLT